MKSFEQAIEKLRSAKECADLNALGAFDQSEVYHLAAQKVLAAWDEWNPCVAENAAPTADAALEMCACTGCVDEFTFWSEGPCYQCLRNGRRISEFTDNYRPRPED